MSWLKLAHTGLIGCRLAQEPAYRAPRQSNTQPSGLTYDWPRRGPSPMLHIDVNFVITGRGANVLNDAAGKGPSHQSKNCRPWTRRDAGAHPNRARAPGASRSIEIAEGRSDHTSQDDLGILDAGSARDAQPPMAPPAAVYQPSLLAQRRRARRLRDGGI